MLDKHYTSLTLYLIIFTNVAYDTIIIFFYKKTMCILQYKHINNLSEFMIKLLFYLFI